MKITVPQRQAGKPTTSGRQMASPNQFAVADIAVMEAGNNLTNFGLEIMQRAKQAENDAEIASKTAKASNEFNKWFNDRSLQNMNYQSLPKDADDRISEITESMLDGMDEGIHKDNMAKTLNTFFASKRNDVMKVARTQAISTGIASTEHSLATLQSTIAESNDPMEQANFITQGKNMIAKGIVSGLYSAEDGEKRIRAFESGVIEGKIRRGMLSNPEAIHSELLDDTKYKSLDPDKRTSLLKASRAMADARANKEYRDLQRREREEENAIKEKWETNGAAVWKNVYDKNMDLAQLEKMRLDREIDPNQYDDMRKAIEVQHVEGVDDPATYGEFYGLAVRGELTVNDILMARAAGADDDAETVATLSRSSADKLLGMVEDGATFTKSKDYQEALKNLEGHLGYTGMMGNILGKDEGIKLARAREEFYRRVKSGENAFDVKDEMLERFVKQRDIQSNLERPRYESEKEVLQAVARKEIRPDEANKQITLIRMIKTKGNAQMMYPRQQPEAGSAASQLEERRRQ